MSRFWEFFIKGMPIGISNTLPGVSGGTMALVLKIYDELVNSIKKLNLKVLIPIGLGAVVGVFLSSTLIINLLENFNLFMTAYLMGLILASAKVTYNEIADFNLFSIILVAVGLIFAYFYSVDINGAVNSESISLIKYFSGGAIGSVAMILPGISGGTILVMLGLYQSVLTAISNFDFMIIIVFGLGVAFGLLIFSWLLSYFLNNYRSLLMALLTGLIIGSTRSVIPPQLTFSVITGFLLGIGSIYLLLKVED
ncbi:MAG TPA: DUF368 domain-containing protein [Halanaerobiales bacterium]|nr:DUF368 domain-containing protein [Halanaerobiales bacterium]